MFCLELILGNLVAKHRKVHLFDIDIPGRQTFKVGRLYNLSGSPFHVHEYRASSDA